MQGWLETPARKTDSGPDGGKLKIEGDFNLTKGGIDENDRKENRS